MRHVIGTVLGLVLASAGLAHDKLHLEAELRGESEVPPVATDTRGSFEVVQSKDGRSAEYTLRVNDGTRLTQAHFHCGPVGMNGPVILFLAGLHDRGWDVDGRWISNAILTDDNVVNPECGATLADIFEQARIGNVYVNVHSVENPAGVVRGQLREERRRRGKN